jgi:hypothetical protein
MTWLESKRVEMSQTRSSLEDAARRTAARFDDWMRYSVKEVLGYRYAPNAESVEEAAEKDSFMQILDSADKFSDFLFGMDSSRQREWRRGNYEWNQGRPVRVANYVQKIADIFPARFLKYLLVNGRGLTAEQLIDRFEFTKGEARRSDYAGNPSGIDLSSFVGRGVVIKDREPHRTREGI